MRVVVLSDTHGRVERIKKVIEQQPQAELFIFLGDGLRDFRQAMYGVPVEEWRVCGNCDFGANEEYTLISYVKDVKFYCVHGHEWNVKYSLGELIDQARSKDANVLLYGHTHQAYYAYRDGLHIFNPGSLGSPKEPFYPTYGTIDIQGKSIVFNHVPLEERDR